MEGIVPAAGALLLIGFICGYGVRELISRWRRVKAQRRFERMVEVSAKREPGATRHYFPEGAIAQRAPPEGGTS